MKFLNFAMQRKALGHVELFNIVVVFLPSEIWNIFQFC